MTTLWSRRGVLTAACATAAATLAGCGSSTIASALVPSRILSFGDGLSDLGQVGGRRYTVNDGSVNVWVEQLAARYGQTITAATTGGLGYAQGNARIVNPVDAAGGSAPSIKAQIDAFLATGSFGPKDLVLISGGLSDVIAEMQAFLNNTITSDQLRANVDQAGRDYGAQIIRLVNAGARFILVTGVYGMGRSPWAVQLGQEVLMDQLSFRGSTGNNQPRSFNEALLVTIVNQGANVLYVDGASFFNDLTISPSSFGLRDSLTVACSSVDAGAGIGTGAGQVSSALCSPATIQVGVDYTTTAFADRVYFGPQAHREFGDRAFDLLRLRF